LIDSTWTAGSRRVSVRLQRVGDGSRFYSGQAVVTGEASLEVMAFPATNLSGRTASDFLILRAEESAGPVPDGAATASLSGATLRLAGTLPDGRRFTGAAPTVQLSGDPARQVAFFWLRAGATRLSGWLDRAATTPQEPWTGAWQLFPLRGRFLPGQQPGNP
jgi:hypothetical protein